MLVADGIGADDLGAEPRHRLAQQAAAAADVEEAQPLERPRRVRIAAETRGDLVADIGQAHRIELVQRTELAVRVPPFGGQRGKALDLGVVDRRSSGFGHGMLPSR